MIYFIIGFLFILIYLWTFKEFERNKKKKLKYPVFRTNLIEMKEINLTIPEINKFTKKINVTVIIDGIGKSVNGKIILN